MQRGFIPFGLLADRGTYTRYGLHARQVAKATLYTEGSDGFVASAAASIATGCSVSEPNPGWDFHPRWTSAFHGARIMRARAPVWNHTEKCVVPHRQIVWFPLFSS